MGNGAIMDLDKASSEKPLDRKSTANPFLRSFSAIARTFSTASNGIKAMKKAPRSRSKAAKSPRDDWDAALNNPEAQEFLESASRQAQELDDKGLIHRP